jgi:peptidoglycan/xylan/chitin deacetylase (PgdA/CDA1 family)
MSGLVLVVLLGSACAKTDPPAPPPAPAPIAAHAPHPSGHDTPEKIAKAEAALASATDHVAPLSPEVAPEVIAHGSRSVKKIALTFDACSTRDWSQYDQRITDELVKANAKATIFLGGLWAKEEAEHVKALATNPLFELGNHTYTHPHMPKVKDDARMKAELVRTQDEVHALTGVVPKLFRPPYGEYDDRVVRIAAQAGLTTIEYDLPSGDPDQHATKERLVEWVLRKAQAGSIIVMHVNHVKFHTAEALPDIIAGLRAKGYELVTVSELLRDEHGDEAATK